LIEWFHFPPHHLTPHPAPMPSGASSEQTVPVVLDLLRSSDSSDGGAASVKASCFEFLIGLPTSHAVLNPGKEGLETTRCAVDVLQVLGYLGW